MSADSSLEKENESNDSWLKRTFNPFVETFQRNECVRQSYELMIESSVVTYLSTRYVFKKPTKAFKYMMVAFLFVPITYWPICAINKRRAQSKPVEL